MIETVHAVGGIFGTHWLDDDGNPAGGTTESVGIRIFWQNGPMGPPLEEVRASDVPRGLDPEDIAKSGASVEDVINAAIGRLQFFQKAAGGKFACRENALAITKLEEAVMWLEKRTADRKKRGVEGTHTP